MEDASFELATIAQTLREQMASMEDFKIYIKALVDQQSSLLIRELHRTRVKGSPQVSPATDKVHPGNFLLSPKLTLEFEEEENEPTVSVNPDEDLEPAEAAESAGRRAEEQRNSLASAKSYATNRTTLTTENSGSVVPMTVAKTGDSMGPWRPGVSEIMVQSSTTQSQNELSADRFTFVGAHIVRRQEYASKALAERGHGAMRLAKRASHYASELSQYTATVDHSTAQSPCLYELVTSRKFMFSMMLVIFLNMILIGMEVEVAATGETPPHFFFIANIVIVCFYALEMLLKLCAYGCMGFFLGADRIWNIFDLSITTLSIVETLADIVATASSNVESNFLRVLRFIRLARALRGIRVIRLIHYVGALRTLVFAIASTAASLFWTLVLLCLVFYTFGVIFAQSVADTCTVFGNKTNETLPDICETKELSMYWRGVGRSMFTLFMVVSGGVEWQTPFRALESVSTFAVVCLVVYLIISVFAILNVVTGVFCNTAIESAHADRDIAIMKQLVRKKKQVAALKAVFQEIDQNNVECVNIMDLKAALEEQKLSTFMESLGISTEDIWTLFMIIDSDESGEITLDEFVSGCMQLHGPAKSLQLAKMSFENKVTRQEIKRLGKQVSAVLKYFDVEVDLRSSSGGVSPS